MKATIVNTVENSTKVVELNNVNTLEDLKDAVDIHEGKFFEGITHTDMVDDSQVLPSLPDNKRNRGYVFYVTPPKNQLKNGAYSRKECYDIIKAQGLAEAVKDTFGRNFTQVATDSLNTFIAEHVGDTEAAQAEPAPAQSPVMSDSPSSASQGIETEKDLILAIIQYIVAVNNDDPTVTSQLHAIIQGVDKVFPNPYSVQDLANMQH